MPYLRSVELVFNLPKVSVLPSPPSSLFAALSSEPDNMAETEYIFMEIARGIKLDDVWLDLREEEISLVLRQLVQLESMSFFPGWRQPSPLAFLKAVQKEVAYLGQFGQPLLLFRRVRREGYRHQERDPALGHSRIRHRSTGKLSACSTRLNPAPVRFSLLVYLNVSRFTVKLLKSMTQPWPLLPENFDEVKRNQAKPSGGTPPSSPYPLPLRQEHGGAQRAPSRSNPVGVLRRRLFHHASW
ncbi:hypothetical protein H2248_006420 [Termitomyces sp. 'cryptogamus']|nr:hypothetical protein H2248_006420 [Termitomyces sp. 'cryptogamus']